MISSGQLINELISTQPPGWSLQAPFYADPAIFDQDREKIFDRQWVMAGHIAQIPNHGDYFLFDYAGANLIIIRSGNGKVNALHNVCRHRGSRVLLDTSGNAKSLTCTYHGWNYAEDGSLRIAPRMPEQFDPECFGLKRCQVALLEGLILVCPGEQPAKGLTTVSESLRPFLQLHGCEGLQVAKRTVFPVQANWKLVIENYLECYHCKPAHREYCAIEIKSDVSADGSASGLGAFTERMQQWQQNAQQRGTWIDDFSSHNSPQPEQEFHGTAYRAPLRESHKTGSEDGEPVAPLLSGFCANDRSETAMAIGPCTYMLSYQDYMCFFQFIPKDAVNSDMIVTWLVDGQAEAGTDFDPERVAWFWTITSEQDKSIIENNAAGVASTAYAPGPPSILESDVAGFRTWYLKNVAPGIEISGADNIPGGRYFP